MEPVNIEFILNNDIVKDIEKVELTIKRTGNVAGSAYRTMLDASDEAFRSMSADAQMQIKAMQDLIVEMKVNEDAQEALKKKFEEGSISVEQYAKGMSRLSLYYAEQKASLQGLQSSINKEIESNRLVEGSYNAKIAKLRQLRETYKDLSDEELNRQEIGESMLDQIRELEAETTKFDESLKQVKTTLADSSSVKGMKESLSQMENQYASLSAEQRKNKDVGGAQAAAIRSLRGDIERAEAQNRSFLDSLKAAPGALGQTVTGIEATTKAAMRFIATPIGAVIAAIVAGLTLLSTWFKRTGEGEQALANITGIFQQVLNGVLNIASALGAWLYKAFTSPKDAVKELGKLLEGQLVNRFRAVGKMASSLVDLFKYLFDAEGRKKALGELGGAYLELMTGVENAAGKIAATAEGMRRQGEIKRQLNALAREEIDLKTKSEAAESKIQQLLTKSMDISRPAKERNAAIKEGLGLIDTTAAKEVDLAKRKMELTRESYKLEYGSLANLPLEAKKSLADIEREYINAQTRLEDKRRSFKEKQNTITRADQAANKKTEMEVFEETLKEKKAHYERFYALMASTDKAFAKGVYTELTTSGESYLQYLTGQIDALQAKRKSGALSAIDAEKLALLSIERQGLTGSSSAIDVLRREMDERKKLYASDLEAYRRYLADKRAELSKDGSEAGYQASTVVNAEIDQVDEKLQDQLDGMIDKYSKGMSKITSLTTSYNNDMAALEQARMKAMKEGNFAQVGVIADTIEGRRQAYRSSLSSLEAEESDFYEVLFGNLEQFSTTALRRAIEEARTFIEQLKASNGGAYASLTADQQQLLNQLLGGLTKAETALQTKLPKDLSKASDGLSEMAGLVSLFDERIGESVQSVANLAGGASDVAMGIATFSTDPLGAITKVIAGVAKIVKVFKDAKESAKAAADEIEKYKFDQYISELEINQLYRERLRISQQLGETTLDYNKRITDELTKQQAVNQAEYDRVFSELQKQKALTGKHTEKEVVGSWSALFWGGDITKTKVVNDYTSLLGKTFEDIEKLYNQGALDEKAAALFEQLQKLKDEGADINQMLADQAEAMRQALTGTTSTAITDGIVSGYEQGLKSAADFADSFEGMMRKAVLQAVRLNYLEPEVAEWYKAFADYASAGTLDKHIEELRAWMGEIVEAGSSMYDAAMDSLGLSTKAQTETAQKTAVQSLTESTGNKLEGHFSAVRFNTSRMVVQLDDLNKQMSRQIELTQRIAENTANLSKLSILETIHQVITRLENDGIKLK